MFLDEFFRVINEILAVLPGLVQPAILAAVLMFTLELGWEKTIAQYIQSKVPNLKVWQPVFIILIGVSLAWGLQLDFMSLLVEVPLDGDLGEALTGLFLAALAMYRHGKVNGSA